MEDAQDGHGVLFVLEQNYVWESVDQGRTQLLVNAAEGFGTLRNRVNAIANRNPKTISKIDGNVVVVGDRSSKVVRNERVICREHFPVSGCRGVFELQKGSSHRTFQNGCGIMPRSSHRLAAKALHR
jgi:hypothetical protein